MSCVGDGGELERALVYGTGVLVRSCCEKRFEKKNAKILRLSQNVFENKFGLVVEKPFDFLFVFVWFREGEEV